MEEKSPQSINARKQTRLMLGVVAIIVLGLFVYVITQSDVAERLFTTGGVVATVNGEEITLEELDRRFEQARPIYVEAEGANLENPEVAATYKEQLLDDLITNTLLLQKANEAGITVSDSEVNAELKKTRERAGSPTLMRERMFALGISEEMLREGIEEQLRINAYLSSATGVDEVEVSEEEIEEYFARVIDALPEEQEPAFDEARLQIEPQILRQKVTSLVADFVQKLRNEASIETNL